MHLYAHPPIRNLLIVQHDVWLRQKALEAVLNPELRGTAPSVCCSARTPTVERCTLRMQRPNVLKYRAHWDAFGPHTPYKSVIDIDEHDQSVT
jgi:hypothetical protein